MDCGLCFISYDEGNHRPKVLQPCCHSFCLQCLLLMESSTQDRIKCPSCKQETPGWEPLHWEAWCSAYNECIDHLLCNRVELYSAVERFAKACVCVGFQVSQRSPQLFPDNVAVLSSLKACQATENNGNVCRNWCVTCSCESTPSCESDGHDTRGLLGFRRRQAQPQLEGLRQQEAALCSVLTAQLEVLATLQPSATQCSQQLQAVQDCAVGLWEGREPWKQQLHQAGEILESSDELHKDLQLLVSQHPISVRSGPWLASCLDPAEHPELRVALLQLRRQGKLQQLEDTHTQDLPLVCVDNPKTADKLPSKDLPLVCVDNPKTADELPSKIQALSNLYCRFDAAWCLELLQLHAPHLQELQLWNAGLEHLQAVQRMPSLRRLEVLRCNDNVRSEALAGVWVGPGLRELRLRLLPKPTASVLIWANRHTLQALDLNVGTPPAEGQEENWSKSCSDLPAFLLGLCGVERLRWLSLDRDFGSHTREACRTQLCALRKALPGCAVSCQICWGSQGW